MNASRLVGKTIKKVHQSRFDSGGAAAGRDSLSWEINAIEFLDGSVLRFIVLEGEGEYGVEGVYPARDIDANDGPSRKGV